MKAINKYTKDDILRLLKRGHTFSYDEIVNAIEKELTAKGFTPEKCDWIVRASDDKGVVSCIVVTNNTKTRHDKTNSPAFCWTYGIDNTVKFSAINGWYSHDEDTFIPSRQIKKLIKTHDTYEESLKFFLEDILVEKPFLEDGYNHEKVLFDLYLKGVFNVGFLEDYKDLDTIHHWSFNTYKLIFEKTHPRQFFSKLLAFQKACIVSPYVKISGEHETGTMVTFDVSEEKKDLEPYNVEDLKWVSTVSKKVSKYVKLKESDEEDFEEETEEEVEEETFSEEVVCSEKPSKRPSYFTKPKRKSRRKNAELAQGIIKTGGIVVEDPLKVLTSLSEVYTSTTDTTITSITSPVYKTVDYTEPDEDEEKTAYNPF